MNELVSILNRYFQYYTLLNDDDRLEFLNRIEGFIGCKEFIPKGNLSQITHEMKVMTAASAVQLSFGFQEPCFDHFKTVLIYPDLFYSGYSEKHLQGEAHPDGALVFSWKHLAFGYLAPDDGVNIGLNVMAQAMSIQHALGGSDFPIFDQRALDIWGDLADDIFEKYLRGSKGIFATYQIATREEFFPKAVELFFEKPEEFKTNMPKLFDALGNLLNQVF